MYNYIVLRRRYSMEEHSNKSNKKDCDDWVVEIVISSPDKGRRKAQEVYVAARNKDEAIEKANKLV